MNTRYKPEYMRDHLSENYNYDSVYERRKYLEEREKQIQREREEILRQREQIEVEERRNDQKKNQLREMQYQNYINGLYEKDENLEKEIKDKMNPLQKSLPSKPSDTMTNYLGRNSQLSDKAERNRKLFLDFQNQSNKPVSKTYQSQIFTDYNEPKRDINKDKKNYNFTLNSEGNDINETNIANTINNYATINNSNNVINNPAVGAGNNASNYDSIIGNSNVSNYDAIIGNNNVSNYDTINANNIAGNYHTINANNIVGNNTPTINANSIVRNYDTISANNTVNNTPNISVNNTANNTATMNFNNNVKTTSINETKNNTNNDLTKASKTLNNNNNTVPDYESYMKSYKEFMDLNNIKGEKTLLSKENIEKERAEIDAIRQKEKDRKKELEMKAKIFEEERKKMYRDSLDQQIDEKVPMKLAQQQYPPRFVAESLSDFKNPPVYIRLMQYSPINKSKFVEINPYAAKKCYLGTSSLSHNPIVDPVTDYKYNKYLLPKSPSSAQGNVL